ncbi:MAG: transglycosylase SLT domain-containing protein [Caulobacteraceae bacterium]|nr:transglycosylase SLT domain-containing protein [Caulobacter sp.]
MHVGAAINLSAVESAVRTAASATGVDFDFLMRTARRESGYNPLAHAPTSSAAGLFQFVEQTWLGVLKRHGAAHGYARYADLIQQGADGRYGVTGADARKAVMDLRFDPGASATMAGELAAEHAAYLRGRTGREPTGGELYAAHFLGPQGSAKLIDAVQRAPSARAADLFPDAAGSNRGVFYRNGQARTVAELYGDLSHTGGSDDVTLAARAQADPGEGAFAAYAGAGRNERQREQAMLMEYLLDRPDPASALGAPSPGGASAAGGAAGSVFTAQLLAMLAQDRQAEAAR